MSFYTDPVYIATVLFLLIVFSEWLGKKKYFRSLGSALIVILATAILANLHVIPSSKNARHYINRSLLMWHH
jgi:energy-coupling factor transporter transmembrane protein EcfT